jgi:hypothetical protein
VDAGGAAEKGPAELVRLAKSFDRLLARLEDARRQYRGDRVSLRPSGAF